MMSFGEIVTVTVVLGAGSLVIIVAVIYLIKQAIKQAREAAVEKQRADNNAEAIVQFQKATDIILSPGDLDDTIRRLRDGTF